MYKKVIIPDFALNRSFDSFNKSEASQYFEWFINSKFERIAYLTNKVKETLPSFKNDFSRNSIGLLNKWVVNNICSQEFNKNVQVKFEKQMANTPLLKEAILKPIFMLSDEDVSKIFDVGLYLGESLIDSNKSLSWNFLIKPKSYIHFAQPIVLASHPADYMNPRFLIENTILFHLNEKEEVPDDFLLKVYDYSLTK